MKCVAPSTTRTTKQGALYYDAVPFRFRFFKAAIKRTGSRDDSYSNAQLSKQSSTTNVTSYAQVVVHFSVRDSTAITAPVLHNVPHTASSYISHSYHTSQLFNSSVHHCGSWTVIYWKQDTGLTPSQMPANYIRPLANPLTVRACRKPSQTSNDIASSTAVPLIITRRGMATAPARESSSTALHGTYRNLA